MLKHKSCIKTFAVWHWMLSGIGINSVKALPAFLLLGWKFHIFSFQILHSFSRQARTSTWLSLHWNHTVARKCCFKEICREMYWTKLECFGSFQCSLEQNLELDLEFYYSLDNVVALKMEAPRWKKPKNANKREKRFHQREISCYHFIVDFSNNYHLLFPSLLEV